MNEIVSTAWLHEKMEDWQKDEFAIVDVRYNLGDSTAGKAAYEESHLPKAVYLQLDQDLSSPMGKHGGRHPLPSLEELAEKLGKVGIGNNTYVVVYDDQGGAMASRFYWLMKHMGHEYISILDGGYSKWVKDGFSTTKEIPDRPRKLFSIRPNEDWSYVNASEVKDKLNDPNTVLIDARESKRYLGKEEPIDPIAGHIPGAVNYFWKNVLTEDGVWKDKERLETTFSNVPREKEVIVYCGSGVSATPTIVALKQAGYSNVKLYPGSWSDWITHKEYPIAKDQS